MSEKQPKSTPKELVVRESPFSPRQLSRLGRFAHAVEKVYETEADINRGITAFGYVNKDGKIPPGGKLFDFDGKILYHLNHAAYSIYESDFANNPALKSAADQINAVIKESHRDQSIMSSGELSDLYKRKDSTE